MEKLLRSKNIDMISIYEIDDTFEHYVYTKDLLDKNLLIHYYHYKISDKLVHPEVETQIFVKTIVDEQHYTFTCYYHNDLVEPPPIVLFRILTDLIEYIASFSKADILNALEDLATSVSICDHSTELEAYEDESAEFEMAMETIAKKRAEA